MSLYEEIGGERRSMARVGQVLPKILGDARVSSSSRAQ